MSGGTVPASGTNSRDTSVVPELPEVEITRRHLSDALAGRTLAAVEIRHERTTRYNASISEVASRLTGRRVIAVGRRGKFLEISLDDGQTMVVHLGMSGRWAIDPLTEAPHTHFVATLDDGTRVAYVDPRTFGFVAVYDEDDIEDSGSRRVGPDAWASPPTVAELTRALDGRTAPIKALLLDQRPMSGLGNIYADEVLFRAGIHPATPGGNVDSDALNRLMDAVREVLGAAIEAGGTTLDDLAYLLPDGRAGENLSQIAVYGREGEPCDRCGTPIERVVIRARSSHFCPSCQSAP